MSTVKTKPIKQSVLNTFARVGIKPEDFDNTEKTRMVVNRFTGQTAEVTPLIAKCIRWVYETSMAYEFGNFKVKVSDFDRIRYFILAEDSNAYRTCID